MDKIVVEVPAPKYLVDFAESHYTRLGYLDTYRLYGYSVSHTAKYNMVPQSFYTWRKRQHFIKAALYLRDDINQYAFVRELKERFFFSLFNYVKANAGVNMPAKTAISLWLVCFGVREENLSLATAMRYYSRFKNTIPAKQLML